MAFSALWSAVFDDEPPVQSTMLPPPGAESTRMGLDAAHGKVCVAMLYCSALPAMEQSGKAGFSQLPAPLPTMSVWLGAVVSPVPPPPTCSVFHCTSWPVASITSAKLAPPLGSRCHLGVTFWPVIRSPRATAPAVTSVKKVVFSIACGVTPPVPQVEPVEVSKPGCPPEVVDCAQPSE